VNITRVDVNARMFVVVVVVVVVVEGGRKSVVLSPDCLFSASCSRRATPLKQTSRTCFFLARLYLRLTIGERIRVGLSLNVEWEDDSGD